MKSMLDLHRRKNRERVVKEIQFTVPRVTEMAVSHQPCDLLFFEKGFPRTTTERQLCFGWPAAAGMSTGELVTAYVLPSQYNKTKTPQTEPAPRAKERT